MLDWLIRSRGRRPLLLQPFKYRRLLLEILSELTEVSSKLQIPHPI